MDNTVLEVIFHFSCKMQLDIKDNISERLKGSK